MEKTDAVNIAYACDISVGIKYLATIGSLANLSLRIINNWIVSSRPKVNTDKIDIVLFTRKYKIATETKPASLVQAFKGIEYTFL